MKKILIMALLIAGCHSPFYKEVDGTSTILGVSLPDEQYIQINALSYLGGSKAVVRDPAKIEHEYECWSTNSYFGIVHTHEYRKSKMKVSLTNSTEAASTTAASSSQQ